ncbi:MAG: nuclear transport factor 2 family protein, partial [Acidimicrobiaceae bacterium]|nr:nuclear transport factor 2 family protein [Acidimicrobiaceae bacterium]
MTGKKPKPNVERLYECLTDGRYDEARRLLHPEYHSNTQPYETSIDALIEEIEAIKQAMTSLKRETILTMADGDMEVILQRVEGIDPSS